MKGPTEKKQLWEEFLFKSSFSFRVTKINNKFQKKTDSQAFVTFSPKQR